MIGEKLPNGLTSVLRALLLGAALSFLGIYIFAASQRVFYAYELEIGEGDLVIQVLHILSGEQPYVEPSLEFTPYTYTPLYFYLGALLTKVMGIGFAPLRLVSFLASLGCMGFLFAFVRRETRSAFFGLIAVGLYAATYRLNGGMFDVVRVDSLNMLFILASIYWARRPDLGSSFFAAVLISLAFATKQSALFIALALSLHAILTREGKGRYLFGGTFLLLTGISTALWVWVSDGWYWFHVFQMPSMAGWHYHRLIGFWRYDMAGPLPIGLGLSLIWILFRWERAGFRDALFFALIWGGLMATAWASRLHVGGGVNVLFPAHAVIALFFGLGLHAVWAAGTRLERGKYLGCCALVLGLLQLLTLVYAPGRYLPTVAQTQSRASFVKLLRSIEGEVLMNYTALLPTLAGIQHFTDGGGYFDIARTPSPIGRRLKNEVRETIRSGRFATLIVPQQWKNFYAEIPGFAEELERLYVDVGPAIEQIIASRKGSVAPTRILVLRDR